MEKSRDLILILATRNAHKAGEIQAVLGQNILCVTLTDSAAVPVTIEDADTFAGNATKKAVELTRYIRNGLDPRHPSPRLFVLADDSGLEVDALNGVPGVHSARFAAQDTGRPGNSPDADNNAKLMRLLQDVPTEKRTARFRCVLALIEATAEGEPRLFDGVCEGRIGLEARGSGGFGYDPLFVPEGYAETLAELGEAVKNRISHRARALEKLRAELTS